MKLNEVQEKYGEYDLKEAGIYEGELQHERAKVFEAVKTLKDYCGSHTECRACEIKKLCFEYFREGSPWEWEKELCE